VVNVYVYRSGAPLEGWLRPGRRRKGRAWLRKFGQHLRKLIWVRWLKPGNSTKTVDMRQREPGRLHDPLGA